MTRELDNPSRVMISLRQIIQAIDIHSRRLEKDYGITVPQLAVLREIEGCDGSATVGEIARSVSMSSATMTVVLDRLAKRGLVTRLKHPGDKRKVYVEITTSGSDFLSRCPRQLHDHFAEKFSGLKPWEQHQIIASLQRTSELMNAEDLPAEPFLSPGPEKPV